MSDQESISSVLDSLEQASALQSREDGVRSVIGQPFTAALMSVRSRAVSTGSDPTIADVIEQLKAAADGPDAEVQKGNVPMPPNVGVIPAYDDKSVQDNYNYLVEMSSLSALYTALWAAAVRTKRGHPQPYRITVASEASQAFADMADCAFQVMSEPLAGFYNFASGTSHVFKKTMSKTELHLEFLGELFQGFSLSSADLLQLDTILTKFVKSLGTITVETESSTSTVDYTLRANQIIRINTTGDDANPVWVFQPRTRIIYMKINSSSYKWATNKASHQSSNFSMQYVVTDFDLNVNKFLASRTKLNQVFESLSGMSMKAFGDKINPPPVKTKK